MSPAAELLRREARALRAVAARLEQQAANLEQEPALAPPLAPPAEIDRARAEKVTRKLRGLGYLERPGKR